jgi:hypothetical protein
MNTAIHLLDCVASFVHAFDGGHVLDAKRGIQSRNEDASKYLAKLLFALSPGVDVKLNRIRIAPKSAILGRRAPTSDMLDIPRVTFPEAVTNVLKEQSLKNPNSFTASEYNAFSGAAIGATLILFILPLFDFGGFIGDFIFSALIGGGAGIFATLSGGQVGEYGNKFGGIVMQGIDKGEETIPEIKKKVEELLKGQ